MVLPVIYHEIYSQLELPEKHRYPILKYKFLYESLLSQFSQNIKIFHPNSVSLKKVFRVHDLEYINQLINNKLSLSKMRRIGFPWSEQLIKRTLLSTGGTCLTAEIAINHGVGIHCSGGYHHAHSSFGSGFCLINDLAIAAQSIIDQSLATKILIIDCDVHQGDGTATIFEKNPDILTLSIHCEKNFPSRKPNSDYDIPLEREMKDYEYLDYLKSIIPIIIKQNNVDFVLYDAGVDVHQDDELGYLKLTNQGIYERDFFILNLCKNLSLPVACVIGGGYRNNHQDLVPAHMQLFKAAIEVF
ncbi:histone deacetylase [Paraphotobacterium marinum]|uniref:Histone deacetylase n=1 Tax=Paraphotobacterium marinum TaxID=1755811 RepID=A0A220VHH2_9GAMM|nr:histone deacetylase [Paraphotobacterium marinum]ASK79858.1 histone deacetylase [Paraphotobacterium marinum]